MELIIFHLKSLSFMLISVYVSIIPPISKFYRHKWNFSLSYSPGASDDKESVCNARIIGLIPGSRRSPREGNSNPLQYSCLKIPMDRGTWWATVHRFAKNQAQPEWPILSLSHTLTWFLGPISFQLLSIPV